MNLLLVRILYVPEGAPAATFQQNSRFCRAPGYYRRIPEGANEPQALEKFLEARQLQI